MTALARSAPATAEVDPTDLLVDGELPDHLDGVHLRTGPGPRFPPVGGSVPPPDGDGMLHRVAISGGRAAFDNRVVGTPRSAGTSRRRSPVNVVRHHGTVLALADGEPPQRIGQRLETLGEETFGGQVPDICAHPKVDPRTGEMLSFRCDRQAPFLTWAVIRADGTGIPARPVEGVGRPSVVHDMAITQRYVVLVVAPLFARAADGGTFAWDEQAGTRIALVPRDGGPVRWCETGTFWPGHTVNAHDAKDPADPVIDVVVLDYVEWAAPPGIVPGSAGAPRLARAVIDPSAGTVRREVLADEPVELPRIDDRLLGRPHRVAAFTLYAGRPRPHPATGAGLAWYDTATGRVTRWEPEDLAVGEPVFAPDPRSEAPGRGWWLALATRIGTDDSGLLVIPAADPAAGPVAVVRLPVPVGGAGHGRWLPTR